MPNLNNKKNKLIVSELDILLEEMGFFSNLKGKKIRFTLRPSITHKTQSNNKAEIPDENLVDLHLQTAKKVDKLLKKHEKILQMEDPEPVSKIQQEPPLKEFVEIREPSVKKPEMPLFKTDLESLNILGNLNQNDELIEIDLPTPIIPENVRNGISSNDLDSWMLGNQDKSSKKRFMGLSLKQVKNKISNQKAKKPQKEVNGVTKTQIELEKTKEEIEERERALQEAKGLEKLKEEELKKRKEEKEREEKLKKIESEKRMKEKKIRERESQKAEKQRQKELKRLEKQKLKEGKIRNKEKEKIEQQQEKEAKRLEVKRAMEEKKKDIERAEIQKQKELKRLETEKAKEEKVKIKEKEEAENQKELVIKKKKKIKLKLKEPKKEEEKPADPMEQKAPEPEITEEKTEEISEEKKEEKPTKQDEYKRIEKEKPDEKTLLDDDVEKLIPIIDELLEKLPDDVVDEFAQSEDFILYEKVVNKYKRK